MCYITDYTCDVCSDIYSGKAVCFRERKCSTIKHVAGAATCPNCAGDEKKRRDQESALALFRLDHWHSKEPAWLADGNEARPGGKDQSAESLKPEDKRKDTVSEPRVKKQERDDGGGVSTIEKLEEEDQNLKPDHRKAGEISFKLPGEPLRYDQPDRGGREAIVAWLDSSVQAVSGDFELFPAAFDTKMDQVHSSHEPAPTPRAPHIPIAALLPGVESREPAMPPTPTDHHRFGNPPREHYYAAGLALLGWVEPERWTYWRTNPPVDPGREMETSNDRYLFARSQVPDWPLTLPYESPRKFLHRRVVNFTVNVGDRIQRQFDWREQHDSMLGWGAPFFGDDVTREDMLELERLGRLR